MYIRILSLCSTRLQNKVVQVVNSTPDQHQCLDADTDLVFYVNKNDKDKHWKEVFPVFVNDAEKQLLQSALYEYIGQRNIPTPEAYVEKHYGDMEDMGYEDVAHAQRFKEKKLQNVKKRLELAAKIRDNLLGE